MSCPCKKSHQEECKGNNNFGFDNTYFLILVLFILLAIIIGGVGY